MNTKISIKLDVSKFDKARIKPKTFNGQNGEVTQQIYDVDLVPLKEKKFIKEFDNSNLYKTHFVVQAQTKEERMAKAKSVYVGEGFTFEKKGEGADVNAEEIPF